MATITALPPRQAPLAAADRRPLASRFAPRLFDLVIAVPLCLITLPVVAVLAACSAVSFRAWPFFSHRRVGLGGREFRFVKIRSLPASTPTSTDKYALAEIENGRFAEVLRRTHLDELPQLWLVVTGRMSLVGPRPEMPHLEAAFEPGFRASRRRIRPGCTGMWQISPAAGMLIAEHIGYDSFYLAHASMRLDLWIMSRTVRAMLRGANRPAMYPPLWALRGSARIGPDGSGSLLADAGRRPAVPHPLGRSSGVANEVSG